MADNLRIGYTSSAGVVYALDIYEFENETLPRQYIDNAAVDFTQLGSTFSTGPVGTQAKIWTVNTYLRNEITNNAQKMQRHITSLGCCVRCLMHGILIEVTD